MRNLKLYKCKYSNSACIMIYMNDGVIARLDKFTVEYWAERKIV